METKFLELVVSIMLVVLFFVVLCFLIRKKPAKNKLEEKKEPLHLEFCPRCNEKTEPGDMLYWNGGGIKHHGRIAGHEVFCPKCKITFRHTWGR